MKYVSCSIYLDVPPKVSCLIGEAFGKWLNYGGSIADLMVGQDLVERDESLRESDLVVCVSFSSPLLISLLLCHHKLSSFSYIIPKDLILPGRK